MLENWQRILGCEEVSEDPNSMGTYKHFLSRPSQFSTLGHVYGDVCQKVSKWCKNLGSNLPNYYCTYEGVCSCGLSGSGCVLGGSASRSRLGDRSMPEAAYFGGEFRSPIQWFV